MKKKFLVVGRAGIDLYSNQSNLDLDKVSSFSRYVGGSAANIAVQLSRLGAEVKLLTKLANDHWGKYIYHYLTSNNVSLNKAQDISPARNSLAITEIKPHSDVVFYRHQPADLLLHPDEIDKDEIAKAQAIIITGTAFSKSPSREAVLLIIHLAKTYKVPIILDLDYRPDGFKEVHEVFLYYKWVIENSDIVIGTRDEFDEVLSYPRKKQGMKKLSDRAICDFFYNHQKLFIIKKGGKGSVAFLNTNPNPNSKQNNKKPSFKVIKGGIYKVKIKKNFGAGDSFAGTFCYHFFKNLNIADCLKKASAAAALVVSRDTCTEAMPINQEINQLIKENDYKILSSN